MKLTISTFGFTTIVVFQLAKMWNLIVFMVSSFFTFTTASGQDVVLLHTTEAMVKSDLSFFGDASSAHLMKLNIFSVHMNEGSFTFLPAAV